MAYLDWFIFELIEIVYTNKYFILIDEF